MKKTSIIGETAAVIAVLDFIVLAITKTPFPYVYILILFGLIFITDWMMGGVADKRIF